MKKLGNLFRLASLACLIILGQFRATATDMVFSHYCMGISKALIADQSASQDYEHSIEIGAIRLWNEHKPLAFGFTSSFVFNISGSEEPSIIARPYSFREAFAVNAGAAVGLFRTFLFRAGPRVTCKQRLENYVTDSYDLVWTLGGFLSGSVVIPFSREIKVIVSYTIFTDDFGLRLGRTVLGTGRSEALQKELQATPRHSALFSIGLVCNA